MSKKELDELSLLCRKLKIEWRTDKAQEDYFLKIDLELWSDNYRLLKAILKEYQQRQPKPIKFTPEQIQRMEEVKKRKEKKRPAVWYDTLNKYEGKE